MKALVTGSTGFVGSHVVETLLRKNYEVKCLIRPETKLEYINSLPVKLVTGSYSDAGSLKSAVEDVDYVFHVGGITRSKSKEGYFAANAKSTASLLNAVIASGRTLQRFELISSQTAAGPGVGTAPVDENTPCHPITTYGRSKLAAEKECLAVRDKIPITIVRPSAVYGPRDKDIFEFFNSANNHIIALSGFGRKLLSLVHVADVADGIVLAAESPASIGEIYFIADDRPYDWNELAEITKRAVDKWAIEMHVPHSVIYSMAAIGEILARVQGKAALINIEKARDMVQKNWGCSVEKAKKDFGYQSKFGAETGIENTIQWYRENGWFK